MGNSQQKKQNQSIFLPIIYFFSLTRDLSKNSILKQYYEPYIVLKKYFPHVPLVEFEKSSIYLIFLWFFSFFPLILFITNSCS